MLQVKSTKIAGDIGVKLRNDISRLEIRKYLNMKTTLGYQEFDTVDWDATQFKMNNNPQHHKIWITKHLSGFCGINKYLQQCDKIKAATCTSCKEPNTIEYTRNMIYFIDPAREELWSNAVNDLDKWLCKQQTEPNLLMATILHLSHKGRRTFENITLNTLSLHQLASEQEKLDGITSWSEKLYQISRDTGSILSFQ